MRTPSSRARASGFVLALASFSSMMTSSSALHPSDRGVGELGGTAMSPVAPEIPASVATEPVDAEISPSPSPRPTVTKPSRERPVKQKPKKLSREKRIGFKVPVEGWITSDFGRRLSGFHHGVDIACPWGRKIKTAKAGRVVYVNKRHSVYGRTIVIAHKGGYSTLYGHNSRIGVSVGKKVKAGQTIAKCGNSGRSTGSHLHFELRRHGRYLPPMKYLTK